MGTSASSGVGETGSHTVLPAGLSLSKRTLNCTHREAYKAPNLPGMGVGAGDRIHREAWKRPNLPGTGVRAGDRKSEVRKP